MNNPRTAVIYARKSTQDQPNTLTVQEEQARLYCSFKGIPVAEVFSDAISGISFDFMERPLVADMLARMGALGATDIVITKLDRGFKSAVDVLLTVEMLTARGIRLHLLDIGLDPTTPTGEMIVGVMGCMARFEGRRRLERQMDVYDRCRDVREATGTGVFLGSEPYGYTAIPHPTQPKKQLLERNQWHAVRLRIRTGDLAGLSSNETARRLNAEGIPSPGAGKTYSRHGVPWVCDGKWKGASIDSIRKDRREHEQPEIGEEKP